MHIRGLSLRKPLLKKMKYLSSIRRQGRLVVALICVAFVLLVGAGGLLLTNLTQPTSAYATAPANSVITTFKGNNARSGQYPNETLLNTSNVNSNQFGKRVSYPVVGQVYAQPVYVPNVSINGALHNVVYVVTEHDQIYAFDADQTTVTDPLWHIDLLTNGATSAPYTDFSCNDLQPEVGITGTPTIDLQKNIIYFVAETKENGVDVERLHALDITTGNEVNGSPTVIQPSVAGSGDGSANGMVAFRAKNERQRAGLLLANNQVYIAFSSFCDLYPYHGWVLSYNYNGSALQLSNAYNDTVNNGNGGIWGSGGGISADAQGNIYATTGNGDFNLNTGGTGAGDAFIKLSPQLQLLDYFAPFNQSCLQTQDADISSGGPLYLPGQNEIVSAGKEGRIYVLNAANMGKYNTIPDVCNNQSRTDVDQVVQESKPNAIGGFYSTPAYWNGSNGQYIFFSGAGRTTGAFPLVNGKLGGVSSSTTQSFNFTGGNPVISSNGTAAGTGILWLVVPANGNNPSQSVLHAYDATNLNNQLYNSDVNAARDGMDSYVKFSAAAVANGEVFVGTNASLTIFGLLPTTGPGTPTAGAGTATPVVSPTTTLPSSGGYNNIGISDDAAPGDGRFDDGGGSYSAQELARVSFNPGDHAVYNGMKMVWPNVIPSTTSLPGSPDNYVANGQVIPFTAVGNAAAVGFLGASSDGDTSGTATINYTSGAPTTFTLGFSDWTLHASTVTPLYGNNIARTLMYRNTSSGRDNTKTYIFYAEVQIDSNRIVQSINLPVSNNDASMHIFAIGSKVGYPTPYNNVGASDDSSAVAGNFDGGYRSYSTQALAQAGLTPGGSVSFNGANFTWPNVESGQPNNYGASGQTLSVMPVGQATTLAFLGASTGGPNAGIGTITYTDNSTQSFALGFSDWTLAAGTLAPSYGNQIVATTPYRNIWNSPDDVQNKALVFYADVALQAGKTIQSVTLPNIASGPVLHVFAVTTKAGQTTPYNNAATSDDANTQAGHYDGNNSYSAEALQAAGITPGSTVSFDGVGFTWPNASAGNPDNYTPNGQAIPVSGVANAGTLAFLGSASGGASTAQAVITYTDGSTQTFTLGLSDWTLGAQAQGSSYGNQIVATSAYRNTPTGRDTGLNMPMVFYSDVALQTSKVVQNVILLSPGRTGGQIHVFALGTRVGAPSSYNNVVTSDDGAPGSGNFDGGSMSYSTQALLTMGITPGGTITYNGATFTWPDAASATPSGYGANGQPVYITPVANASTLAFLGAASGGPAAGIATITYSDGSTQTFSLGFSDWTLAGSTVAPSYGNQIVATVPYRNTPGGRDNAQNRPNVFYASVTLQPNKTVTSVTLPVAASSAQMRIFAVATKAGQDMPYGNAAVSDDGTPGAANFDGRNNNYSLQALQNVGLTPGGTLNFDGATFTWPNVGAGLPDNYLAQGQALNIVPINNAGALAFLGTSSGGPTSGQATITYTDGTTQNFTLGFSDWTLGAQTVGVSYGNQIVAATGYRNSTGGQGGVLDRPYVFYTDVTLLPGKTIQNVILPVTGNGPLLHIFAVTTKVGAASILNNTATTNDGVNSANGGFDGGNASYSAQALQSVGIKSGATVAFNGVNFTWPNVAAGNFDNYQVNSQTITVTPVANATTIAFLGAASGGSASGNGTITYTDGTTQSFNLGFSDWTLGAGTVTPSYGNQVVATTAYRDTGTSKDFNGKANIFYSDVALQAGKTVASVTLPSSVSGAQLHVFAVGTK